MRDRYSLLDRHARIHSRCILNYNIPPIFYFILLAFTFVQTVSAISIPQSKIHKVIKWLQPSTFIPPQAVLYIVFAPVLFSAVVNLLQIWWAVNDSYLKTTIFKHYLIKLGMIVSNVLCYGLFQTITCSAIKALIEGEQLASGFAGAILGFLIPNIFGFLIFDINLSPYQNRVYAQFDFPNALTVLHLMRIIISILSPLTKNGVIVFLFIIFIPLSLVLIKSPILTWRYNKANQMLIGMILVWTFLTLIQFIQGGSFEVGFYVVLVPLLGLLTTFVLQMRIMKVMKNENFTVISIKVLQYMVFNIEWQRDSLDMYLMHHLKKCEDPTCKCQDLIQFYAKSKQNAKQTFEIKEEVNSIDNNELSTNPGLQKYISHRHEQAKKQQKKNNKPKNDDSCELEVQRIAQQKHWYIFIIDMIDRQINIDQIPNLPDQQRKAELKKVKMIKMQKAQILMNKLGQHYKAMIALWMTEKILSTYSQITFPFLIRYYILEFKGQEKLQSRISQDYNKNAYPLNYYSLQTNLTNFRIMLMKIVRNAKIFWNEASSSNPDQKKLLQLIKNISFLYDKIKKKYREICDKGKLDGGNSQYDKLWNKKVTALIDYIYIPFINAFCNQNRTFDAKLMEIFRKQVDKKTKNLIFYDADADTGISTVNLQEGPDFAKIVSANKQFWDLVNTPKIEGAKPDNFLPKQMVKSHTQTMKRFLRSGQYFLEYHPGFIVDSTNQLVQIEFTGQILPNLYEGIQMALFIRSTPTNTPIILINKVSNILCFNNWFDVVMEGKNLDDLDEIINKQVMQNLERDKKSQIVFEDDLYRLKVYHEIVCEKEPNNWLYFLQIEKQNEDFSQLSQGDTLKKETSFKGLQSQLIFSKGPKVNNQMKILQEEEVPLVLSIIKNNKKCKNISRWWKTSIILFMLVFCLLVVGMALTNIKQSMYVQYFDDLSSLNILMNRVFMSSYTIRKINIQSYLFNNALSLKPLVVDVESIKQNSNNLNQYWDPEVTAYQLHQNNTITTSSQTMLMIINKFIMASLTTISNDPNTLSFNFCRQQISPPLPHIVSTFYRTIYNAFYAVIPHLQKVTIVQLLDQASSKISKFVHTPLYLISIILIIIAIFSFMISVLMRYKLNKNQQLSYCLFENLKTSHMESRINTLKHFEQVFLNDMVPTEQMEDKGENMTGVITKKSLFYRSQSNFKTERKNLKNDKMKQSFENGLDFESTNRQLFPQTSSYNIQQEKVEQKKPLDVENKIKIKEEKNLFIYLKIVTPLLTIIIISFTILAVQLHTNAQIEKILHLRNTNGRMIWAFNGLTSYIQEFGFQRWENSRKYNGLKVQFPNFLNMAYETLRNRNEIEYINPIIEQKQRYFKKTSICQILHKMSPHPRYKTMRLDCTPEELTYYKDSFMRQVMVQFLQKSRVMYEKYKDDMGSDELVEYINDKEHEYFFTLSAYFTRILIYEKDIIQQAIEYEINLYRVGIIVPSILMILTLFLIYHFWLRKFRKQLFVTAFQIRVVYQMVSFAEIQKDKKLYDQIKQNTSLIKFLY